MAMYGYTKTERKQTILNVSARTKDRRKGQLSVKENGK